MLSMIVSVDYSNCLRYGNFSLNNLHVIVTRLREWLVRDLFLRLNFKCSVHLVQRLARVAIHSLCGWVRQTMIGVEWPFEKHWTKSVIYGW